MPPYLRLGSIPPKRHTKHPATPGFLNEGLYYEEVISTHGFSGAYSIAYHLRPPTRVSKVEPVASVPVEVAPQEMLRHHHLKTRSIPIHGDPVTGRVPMFTNADVTISRCRPSDEQVDLFRNATADEIIFVHRGRGVVRTHFGHLDFKPFDYIVIPRCTTYRVDADLGQPVDFLVIESTGALGFPDRYLNRDGQFKLGAPFCERDLHGPSELIDEDRADETTVVIKDGDRRTRYTLAHHPFDVVGWDGMVYPFTFNADDFEPITGTIHQPPPIHQTFESRGGFVVCTFAPRMLDTHPSAVKIPYAHSNVESDELLYYVRGKFGSRRGVEESSFTLHPHGIPHGPHPGTLAASWDMTRTDELAVMVDTFRPLHLTKQALAYDDPAYPLSWMD